MRTITTKIFALMLIGLMSTGLLSCKKLLDVDPEEVLTDNNMYKNVYDADAAVIGVYGKFMNLASNYIIVNELRGDLMDVTPNSDRYMKQLSNFTVTADNPYVDPRPYYEVILYINDALSNFKKMREEGKLKQDEFDMRYSDLGALRSWIYLQLVTRYGEVPYVTEPVKNIDDLKNAALFPRVKLDQLVKDLISFTEALPWKDDYPSGSTLYTTVDGYSTSKMFINKYMVLGDLYLWDNNYTQAATNYRKVLEWGTLYGGNDNYTIYKMTYSYNVGTAWINIFSSPYGERYGFNHEAIWALPFDKSFSPTNPFIPLFGNEGKGKYLIAPSDWVMNNWSSQTRSDGSPYDPRGQFSSWTTQNTQPVAYKMIAGYSALSPFETNGKWMIYRAGILHLRFAEATNRDNFHKLAYAFLNNGILNSYDPNPSVARNVKDVTNMMNTLDYPDPYKFDAREGEFPRFRGDWYRHTGIRNHAGVMHSTITPADSVKYFDMSNPNPYYREVKDHAGLALFMEDKLVQEGALETAFEGYRWGDLLRIALRREKEAPGTGVAFLQKHINDKFQARGETAPNMTNKDNWFLPFNW